MGAVTCPGCRRLLDLPDSHVGREVRCVHCWLMFVAGNEMATAMSESASRAAPPSAEKRWDDQREHDGALLGRPASLAGFKPGGRWGATVRFLLGLLLLLQVGVFFSNLMEYESVRHKRPWEVAGPPDNWRGQLALAAAYGLVQFGTAIAFFRWLWRVHANLHALGARDLKYTSRLAVGCWFIPIYNLFCPLDVAQEIWRHSDPDRRVGKPKRLITAWWLTWLLASALAVLVWHMSRNIFVVGALRDAARVAMFGNLLSITACLLALMIVSQIDANQTARAERLRTGVALVD